MTIKHIVLSGGGQIVFNYFGIIKHLLQEEFINKTELKSIYASSAGSVVAVILCLNYCWSDIEEYIIRCPWNEKINLKLDMIMNAYTTKGIYDTKLFEIILKPLFLGNDLSVDITMEELYNYSNIDLHIFSFELNSFEHVNISHTTHPHTKVLDALRMSCSYPTLISPLCSENKCYVDGGFTRNYPLNDCIEEQIKNESEKDEIFGILNKNIKSDTLIDEDSSIMDFLKIILQKLTKQICTACKQEKIKYELELITNGVSFEILFQTISNEKVRKDLISEGNNSAKNFLEQIKD